MKQGRTIFDLAEELERQRKNRKDFVVDTRKLAVKTKQGQSQSLFVGPPGRIIYGSGRVIGITIDY